jgi:signal transduction histidine kinase/ActR/RegA family two-component response regulator
MGSVPASSWAARCAQSVSALVFCTALAVLLGWTLNITSLEGAVPGWPKMSPLTSSAFMLTGLAIWLATVHSSPFACRLARGLAGVVALAGLIRLADHIWALNLGLDMLWFHESLPGSAQPARMSPATAFEFSLLGIAVALATSKRFIGVFQFLSLLVCLVGGLSLSRYLYGGEPILWFAQMAVHTSTLFFVLGAGVLCLRIDGGLMALILSDTLGGSLVRRLLPPALVVPVALGWLRLQGQRAGWYGTEAGLALFALSNVIVFGALIWVQGTLLHRVDISRKRAKTRLQAQLERLNLLQHITRAIAERQDLKSIFQVVIRSVEEQMPVEFACVCLPEEGAASLKVECVGTRSSELALALAMVEEARIPVDENGLSQCMRGCLVYEPDLSNVAFAFPQRLLRGGLRSVVIAPLMMESQVFGVLVTARVGANAFDSTDCEFLRQLSEHIALAARQSQLLESLQSAYDDLRRSEQAVLEQERLRALGEMASGIAHDINNALSPAALYADSLLESEGGLSERGRSGLALISSAISDVAATVGRLREFYRQREQQVALEPVQLNALVLQVLELTRSRWKTMPEEHGVVVHAVTDLSEDLPAVFGVESEIREALTNLVFNAVDAMPAGGTLTIRTRLASTGRESVVLEVVDTGVGMDAETRRRCLEPFFTTKGERGTGLGLAMVYGIARRHGADLELDSEPGRGATVRMILSAVRDGEMQVSGAQRIDARPPPMRLLLVDDDPIVLRSLSEILTGEGHDVVAADGGEAGVELFRRALDSPRPFDVVITDLGMPRVDGRKVARAIKEAAPSVPVVLLSGWGERLVAAGSVPAHVDKVLSKPPKLRELRAALADCGPAVRPPG